MTFSSIISDCLYLLPIQKAVTSGNELSGLRATDRHRSNGVNYLDTFTENSCTEN